MQTLFDPERHEALVDERWDPGVVRAAIAAIASDALASTRAGFWTAHPLDDQSSDDAPALYTGAAGVYWGLTHLASAGAIAGDDRYQRWACALPAAYRACPDTYGSVPSYFLGESGIVLTALRARHSAELAERLLTVVQGNVHNPTLEALWGAPGSALAAVFAHELGGEERWRAAYLENVRALQDTWREHAGDGCALWQQDLYGKQRRLLGAAHGFAGNVFTLLRGWALVPERERDGVLERALRSLQVTAEVDGERANWPSDTSRQRFFVQWCHGAPGMVTSFARAPAEPELDTLLGKAGELTWQAGPLRKGPNLCHGTAGNGAAFLALFSRSGDERWLERARRFAMHAARQVSSARAAYGRGRYTLWTGDVGVAVYLWQCLNGTPGLVSLDF
jgi:lanthionine synthetase-like protein